MLLTGTGVIVEIMHPFSSMASNNLDNSELQQTTSSFVKRIGVSVTEPVSNFRSADNVQKTLKYILLLTRLKEKS
jgi:hypothetical protein